MFMSFDGIKCSVPTVSEVKDRHVEDQHRIVRSALAWEYSSPPPLPEQASLPSRLAVSVKLESLAIHFIVQVHRFYLPCFNHW